MECPIDCFARFVSFVRWFGGLRECGGRCAAGGRGGVVSEVWRHGGDSHAHYTHSYYFPVDWRRVVSLDGGLKFPEQCF